MNTKQMDVDAGLQNERYLAGLLLILGFLLLIPGVYLFATPQGDSVVSYSAQAIERHIWERNLVSAGVAVTLLGLVILEDVLRQAGGHILSRLGLVCFTLGTVMWLTVNALNLSGEGWVAALETYFIVFAFMATAFYSGAILRTRLLPTWVGIVALVWSIGMLIFVLPGNRGPLFYEPALLLIAIALLLKRMEVPSAETVPHGAS